MIKEKKYYIIYFGLTFFISCRLVFNDCENKVTPEFISSKCDLENVNILEIDTIYTWDTILEKPLDFDYTSQIIVGKIDSQERLPNKISFTKKNKNVEWFYVQKGKKYRIFPLVFKKKTWYLFRGFNFYGSPLVEYFMYIDSVGGVEIIQAKRR